jgi:hypothetical protein
VTRELALRSTGKGLQVALMAAGAYYFASWLIGPRLDPDFNWVFFAVMFLVGALGHVWRASPKS